GVAVYAALTSADPACCSYPYPERTSLHTHSLHDALPIFRAPPRDQHRQVREPRHRRAPPRRSARRQRRAHLHRAPRAPLGEPPRSEEHTSELQSRENLVCRLLLEKKK